MECQDWAVDPKKHSEDAQTSPLAKTTTCFLSHRAKTILEINIMTLLLFYKSTKQKLTKETSITKYPKYAQEISRQSQIGNSTNTTKNKYSKSKNVTYPSSWLHFHLDKKTTRMPKLPNGSSRDPLSLWKYQRPKSYFNIFPEKNLHQHKKFVLRSMMIATSKACLILIPALKNPS
ncbi:chitin-binding type-4 domain-containing protein [Caerostris extrusa]|uniref:Chitin-binding type-4 domain-containing protein n=1 Tax=Caerostris extrusa TaxID=172846 RepID=A0AAV4X0W3_CAEEX|nr:chitin-binding type-4 domain-containing protein [Caerostris extrusa]